MKKLPCAIAILAFRLVTVGCVPLKPLQPETTDTQTGAPENQGTTGSTGTTSTTNPASVGTTVISTGIANTQASNSTATSAGSAMTLTLLGDGYAADILATNGANDSLSANFASALSADFLTWKLTQRTLDSSTKISRYSSNMALSPIVGNSHYSFASQLKTQNGITTNTVVRPGLLASDIEQGNISIQTPSSQIVVVQIGTDDFCAGTPNDVFATNFEGALSRVTNAYPNAKIVVLPALNLNDVASIYPVSHSVTGFAGSIPNCKQTRELFNSCAALSKETPRSFDDLKIINETMKNAAANINKQSSERVLFVDWNVTNPTATLDCTHVAQETLDRMAQTAWPQVQKLLQK